MSDNVFNLKAIPKDKPEPSKFTEYYDWGKVSLKTFEGKIIFMNYLFPGKHIYRPYYVNNGNAHPMSFNKNSNWEQPFFTLSELNYTDVIMFWTIEQAEKEKTK